MAAEIYLELIDKIQNDSKNRIICNFEGSNTANICFYRDNYSREILENLKKAPENETLTKFITIFESFTASLAEINSKRGVPIRLVYFELKRDDDCVNIKFWRYRATGNEYLANSYPLGNYTLSLPNQTSQ